MALQRVLAEDVEEGLLPTGVEGGGGVEYQRNQRADVLDRDGLSVKVEEGAGLLLEKGGMKTVVFIDIFYQRRIPGAVGWLCCGALLSGAKASSSRVDLLLGGLGFTISFGGTR